MTESDVSAALPLGCSSPLPLLPPVVVVAQLRVRCKPASAAGTCLYAWSEGCQWHHSPEAGRPHTKTGAPTGNVFRTEEAADVFGITAITNSLRAVSGQSSAARAVQDK